MDYVPLRFQGLLIVVFMSLFDPLALFYIIFISFLPFYITKNEQREFLYGME